MGFTPFIFGFKYVVSENFINCLLDEGVEINEFRVFNIDIENLKENYYLLFVPMIPNSEIIFSKSLLFPEKELLLPRNERKYLQVTNHEEYMKLIKSNSFIRWERICLKSKFESRSIINLQGLSNLFFSDSLLNKMVDNNLSNVLIKDDVQLVFEELVELVILF
jgi:hypothetical protein